MSLKKKRKDDNHKEFAIQRHLRFANLHNNSNVKIERDFKV